MVENKKQISISSPGQVNKNRKKFNVKNYKEASSKSDLKAGSTMLNDQKSPSLKI